MESPPGPSPHGIVLLVLGLLLKRPQGSKAAAPCPTLCLCYLCVIGFVISYCLDLVLASQHLINQVQRVAREIHS